MSMSKMLKAFFKKYPGYHFHLDVTTAGVDSYHVEVSIRGADGVTLLTLNQFGSGDLDRLKDKAIERVIGQFATVA